eukprot:g13886.t1
MSWLRKAAAANIALALVACRDGGCVRGSFLAPMRNGVVGGFFTGQPLAGSDDRVDVGSPSTNDQHNEEGDRKSTTTTKQEVEAHAPPPLMRAASLPLNFFQQQRMLQLGIGPAFLSQNFAALSPPGASAERETQWFNMTRSESGAEAPGAAAGSESVQLLQAPGSPGRAPTGDAESAPDVDMQDLPAAEEVGGGAAPSARTQSMVVEEAGGGAAVADDDLVVSSSVEGEGDEETAENVADANPRLETSVGSMEVEELPVAGEAGSGLRGEEREVHGHRSSAEADEAEKEAAGTHVVLLPADLALLPHRRGPPSLPQGPAIFYRIHSETHSNTPGSSEPAASPASASDGPLPHGVRRAASFLSRTPPRAPSPTTGGTTTWSPAEQARPEVVGDAGVEAEEEHVDPLTPTAAWWGLSPADVLAAALGRLELGGKNRGNEEEEEEDDRAASASGASEGGRSSPDRVSRSGSDGGERKTTASQKSSSCASDLPGNPKKPPADPQQQVKDVFDGWRELAVSRPGDAVTGSVTSPGPKELESVAATKHHLRSTSEGSAAASSSAPLLTSGAADGVEREEDVAEEDVPSIPGRTISNLDDFYEPSTDERKRTSATRCALLQKLKSKCCGGGRAVYVAPLLAGAATLGLSSLERSGMLGPAGSCCEEGALWCP